jgi:hypothetical protein
MKRDPPATRARETSGKSGSTSIRRVADEMTVAVTRFHDAKRVKRRTRTAKRKRNKRMGIMAFLPLESTVSSDLAMCHKKNEALTFGWKK